MSPRELQVPPDSNLAAQSAGGGVTTFSMTAGAAIRAGYSTQNPITDQVLPGMPALDQLDDALVICQQCRHGRDPAVRLPTEGRPLRGQHDIHIVGQPAG